MSISSLHPTIETASMPEAPITINSTDSAVWILSAITPPSEPTMLDESGDENWYVRIIDEYLRETIRSKKPIPELIRDAIETAGELYATRTPDSFGFEPESLPSAMCSCVRMNSDDNKLEYFSIGDGAIWAQSPEHSARICASEGSLHRPEYDPNDQWRLSFSPDSVDYARHGRLEQDEYRTIVIGTSALDVAIEEHGVYESWRSFTDCIAGAGTRAAVRDVKEFYDTYDISLPRQGAENDIGVAAVFQFS